MTVFIRTSKRTELQGRFPSARSRLVLNRDHWVNDRLLFALVWSHHDRFQELRTDRILPITVSGITVTEKATSELGLAYKMVDGSVQSASVSSFATLPTQGQSFSQFMAYDYADPATQYLGGIGGGLDSNKTTSFGAFVTPGRFRFGVYNGGQAEMTQTASGVIFHSGWMIGDGSSSSYGIHCAVNQFPSVSSTATWTGYANNNIYPQSLGSYTTFRFYNYIKVWLYWKRAISHAEHISLYSPDTRWSYLHDLGARHYSIPSASAASYNNSVSDSLSLTDTRSGILTAVGSTSESLSLADTRSGMLTAVGSTSESLSLADTINGGLDVDNSVSDSLSLADTVNRSVVQGGSISDSVTLLDNDFYTPPYPTTSGQRTRLGAVSDTATITDSQSGIGVLGGSASDQISLSDNHSGIGQLLASIAETLTASDTISGTIEGVGQIAGSVAEILTLTDQALSSMAVTAILNEALTLTDTSSAIGVYNVRRLDSISLDDDITGEGGTLNPTRRNRGGWATNQRRLRKHADMIREDDEIVAAIIARLLQ